MLAQSVAVRYVSVCVLIASVFVSLQVGDVYVCSSVLAKIIYVWPKVKAKENKKKKQHEQQQHTHTTTSTRSVCVTNSTQWNCMESVCVL